MVVACVVVLGGGQLLGGGGLGGSVQVLDLGLAEDAAERGCQNVDGVAW